MANKWYKVSFCVESSESEGNPKHWDWGELIGNEVHAFESELCDEPDEDGDDDDSEEVEDEDA